MTRVTRYNEYIFTVSDVLTAEECRGFIEFSEEAGYGKALIHTTVGLVDRPSVRNHDRIVLDDPANAEMLWHRIKPFVPETAGERRVAGTNERLRYFRYHPGQQFKAHFDGRIETEKGELSVLGYMVYLNDDYEGGATRFIDLDDDSNSIAIQPKTGMALLFEPNVLHEGLQVTRGRKYVLRTDVMYVKPADELRLSS